MIHRSWLTDPRSWFTDPRVWLTLLLFTPLLFSGFFLLFPSREIRLEGQPAYNPLFKGYVYVQEVRLKKDYINGFGLHLNPSSKAAVNRISVMLLDSSYTVRYARTMLNAEMEGPRWVDFKLKRPLKMRKGSRVYLCVTSLDGSLQDFGLLTREPAADTGVMWARTIVRDDIPGSIRGAGQKIPVQGSALHRTWESNLNPVWSWRIGLGLLALAAVALLWFLPRWSWVKRIPRLRPEKIYLALALLFGTGYLLVTPPFMVPDGNYHFQAAWWASEYDLTSDSAMVPEAVMQWTAASDDLRFSTVRKTSLQEIRSADTIPHDPARRAFFSQNYKKILSYYNIFNISFLFPGLGITAGRWFGLHPLWLMYLGRLANLICSVLIIFLAIRIIPLGKWLLFLLALMPMPMSLIASNSYWGIRIALSFLLIAIGLFYALNRDRRLKWYDIAIFLGVTLLLAVTRLQYAALGMLLLMIILERLRFPRKGIAAAMLLLLPLLFGFHDATGQQEPAGGAQEMPALVNTETGAETNLQYVKEHPFGFLKILWRTTFNVYGWYYIDTFIGRLGWLTVPLPQRVVSLYLVMLIAATLFTTGYRYQPRWHGRLVMLFTFLLLWVAIHAVIYIGMFGNRVGQDFITGVAGRYVIPFSPLLFLAFASNLGRWVKGADRELLPRRWMKPVAGRLQQSLPFLPPLLFPLTAVIAFLSALYALLMHYYIL